MLGTIDRTGGLLSDDAVVPARVAAEGVPRDAVVEGVVLGAVTGRRAAVRGAGGLGVALISFDLSAMLQTQTRLLRTLRLVGHPETLRLGAL